MLNQVTLIGRMGQDADLRFTAAGDAVANFSLAVERNTARDEQGNREVDWVPIVAWRKDAEFAANYLGKGRLVAVNGRLQVRDWIAQDGSKRRTAEVVASRLVGLDRPKEQGEAHAPETAATSEDNFIDPFAGDEPAPMTAPRSQARSRQTVRATA